MAGTESVAAPLRVVYVDDDPLAQEGALALLHRQPGWLTRTTPVEQVTDVVIAFQPHVALVGVHVFTAQGLCPIRHLAAMGVRCLAYGVASSLLDLRRVVAAGADGFVRKGLSADQMVAAVQECAAGRQVIRTGNEHFLLHSVLQGKNKAATPSNCPTPREADVLHGIAQGLSNAEIARHLGISTGTVKARVGRLLRKFGMTNRTQLAVRAEKADTTLPLPYRDLHSPTRGGNPNVRRSQPS